MLQLIAGLTLLVELPVWLLMIFRPTLDTTRQLVSSYLIFIPLGLLFIFLGIGLIAGQSALSASVSAALSSGDAGAATDALKGVQGGLSGLGLTVIAAMSVMDLAGGHIIFADGQKRGVSQRTMAIFLVLTYLTGPVGMFVFVSWRYLTMVRQHDPAVAPTHSVSAV